MLLFLALNLQPFSTDLHGCDKRRPELLSAHQGRVLAGFLFPVHPLKNWNKLNKKAIIFGFLLKCFAINSYLYVNFLTSIKV